MVKYHFRDMTRHQIWKLPHQNRGCAKLNIHVCRIKLLLTALSRDSRTVGNARVTSRGSCECTFVAPGSITGSSSVLVCRVRPRIYYMLHTQGMMISKGSTRPARNFSLFFVRRYGRVNDDWNSLAVFFQGPIGLDGPKGDPVSSPHNLHFNFVVALQACEINCFVKAREAIFYFATLNVLRITLFNRIMVMGVREREFNHNIFRAARNLFYQNLCLREVCHRNKSDNFFFLLRSHYGMSRLRWFMKFLNILLHEVNRHKIER